MLSRLYVNTRGLVRHAGICTTDNDVPSDHVVTSVVDAEVDCEKSGHRNLQHKRQIINRPKPRLQSTARCRQTPVFNWPYRFDDDRTP